MQSSSPEILIIGAAIMDILARPADRVKQELPTTPMDDIRMSLGGDALNESMILAHFKRAVQLETVIGNDDVGRYILERCEKSGVMVPARCVKEDLASGINIVLISEDGQRRFLTNPRGGLRALKTDDIRMPFPESVRILCFASIFVFPHIGVSDLTRIFSQAKAQGILVCADMTACKNHETAADLAPAFAYVDYLLPNASEAMLLSGASSVEDAARILHDSGVKTVVIKDGARGCYLYNDSVAEWVPAVAATCIDTTGAGDSFVAGFLHALADKKPLRACAAFANQCGAKSVSAIGATTWVTEASGCQKNN